MSDEIVKRVGYLLQRVGHEGIGGDGGGGWYWVATT